MIPPGREQKREREDFYRKLRVSTALVLITAGVIMCLWVFGTAYKVLTDPQKLEAFQTIVPRNPELRTLDIDGEKVELPLGLFNFMGYVVACFLLFIAGGIGGGFISGGVKLLQPGTARLESRIRKDLDGLGAKLTELASVFAKRRRTE